MNLFFERLDLKILVIAAHPDDEIYGMGGTIAKLNQQKNEVYTLIITEGCSSQYKGKAEIIDQKRRSTNSKPYSWC